MREVPDHQLGVLRQQFPQAIRVKAPFLGFDRLPEHHVTADAERQLIQRLIAGECTDNAVSRLQDGVHCKEDRLLRGCDKHFQRGDGLIGCRHLLAQFGKALRFRIAQGEAVPASRGIVIGEREEVGQI